MSQYNPKREQGYEKPFHESPIDAPNGWSGGCVEDIGGGIFVRCWTNFNPDEKQQKDALEVIYNVSQDEFVELNKYKWTGERYEKNGLVKSVQAGSTDEDQSQTAERLMKENGEQT